MKRLEGVDKARERQSLMVGLVLSPGRKLFQDSLHLAIIGSVVSYRCPDPLQKVEVKFSGN